MNNSMASRMVRLGLVVATIAWAGWSQAQVVTNPVPYAWSFEAYTNGSMIVTNLGWEGEADAVSAVDTNYSAPSYPIDTNHLTVAQLHSDVTTYLDGSGQADGSIWVDYLVKPRRWDDENTPQNIPQDAQLAIFVDTNGFLNILHADNGASSGFPNYPGGGATVWSVVDDPAFTVPEDTWVRLSVHLDLSLPDYSAHYFRIMINGTYVTHSNAHYSPIAFDYFKEDVEEFSGDDAGDGVGTWFPITTLNATNQIRAIGFRGTGFLDDLVVTDVAPDVDVTHTIIASVIGGGSISPSGNVPVPDGSNKTFTVLADSGYLVDGITVVENGATNVLGEGSTGYTFTNVIANGSITAYFSQEGGMPGWWYTATGVDPTNQSENVWRAYISSTDPEDPEFEFEVTGTWRANGSNYVQWRSIYVDTNLPPFGILAATNLMDGFDPVGTHPRVAGTGDEVITNTWHEAAPAWPVYYRVVATNSAPE